MLRRDLREAPRPLRQCASIGRPRLSHRPKSMQEEKQARQKPKSFVSLSRSSDVLRCVRSPWLGSPATLLAACSSDALVWQGGLTAIRRSLPRSLRNRMQEHLTPDLPINSASATEPPPASPHQQRNPSLHPVPRHRHHQRRCSSQISASARDPLVSVIASHRLAFFLLLSLLPDRRTSRPA